VQFGKKITSEIYMFLYICHMWSMNC